MLLMTGPDWSDNGSGGARARLRILQLITRNQLRGAEVFAAQLSDQLAERGHHVVLAWLLGDERVLPTRPDVRQVALGAKASDSAPFSATVWRNLRKLLRDFDADVVQANGSETWKYALLLRLTEPARPVIYRNISVMSMWAGSGLKRRLVGAALRRMSHVASVTKVGKRDLIEGFGLREDRVSVVPIGVPVPPALSDQERGRLRREVRQEFGFPADCPLVIHVGSFTPEKNHRELLQAFARVRAEVPEARLLLVGEGPLMPETEQMAAGMALFEPGTASAVAFAGSRADATRLISAADALALPSLREGLPGVILEAGAVGVPVVAYDVGGVREVVQDGVSGLLTAERDVVGLASGLTRLLGDATCGRACGLSNRMIIRAEFGLDRVVDRFDALYSVLADMGSGAGTV